jgi:hypothetical protein
MPWAMRVGPDMRICPHFEVDPRDIHLLYNNTRHHDDVRRM